MLDTVLYKALFSKSGQSSFNKTLNFSEFQASVEYIQTGTLNDSCASLLTEGTLFKYTGKRMMEHYIFLFDGLIILTKQNKKWSSVTVPVGDYKLKEKFQMRKVDIIDKDDTGGMFEDMSRNRVYRRCT